jgi:hypothetical protein
MLDTVAVDINQRWRRTVGTSRYSGSLDADKLRALAAWYREFADRAGSIAISESRLRIADELDEEAGLLDEEGLDEEGKAAGG